MAIEYQKGKSFLHELDARTKLLIFLGTTILAILVVDPILMSAIFFGLYYLGTKSIDNKLLKDNLKVLIVIFLSFAFFQILFYNPSDPVFLFYLIPFKNWIPITIEGLVRSIAVFFRFFTVVLSVHLLLYTTPPVDLALTITKKEKLKNAFTDIPFLLGLTLVFWLVLKFQFPGSVDQINAWGIAPWVISILIAFIASFLVLKISENGLPPEMGVALTLGFATVGILSKQTQKITDAQKARGYDVQPKNLIKRVQVLTALLLPIFVATLERSQDISIAILSRGFDYNISKRTYRRQLIFKKQDYLVMGIIAALLSLSVLLNYINYGNFTELFIKSFLN